MAYSIEDRARAVEIVQANDGTVDNATLAKIRDAINAPDLPARTVRNWVKVPQTENFPQKEISEEKQISVTVVEPVSNDDLTDKQWLFVEQYFICELNGTEAAMRVYDCKDRTVAKSIASENLAKPAIRSRIDARLAEFHLTANEVLTRLAFHARGSMEAFIDPGSGTIDLNKAEKAKQLGLIKKYKTKFTTTTKQTAPLSLADGDEKRKRVTTEDVEVLEVEIELYDQQAALVHLGKHLNLFNDKSLNLNVDLTQLSDDDLNKLIQGGKL